MNPTYKTISRVNATVNATKSCFLCDCRLQNVHIRNVDQLFYDPKSNSGQTKSLAIILSGILEQNIEETSVHSKIVCRKCQQMCIEYERLDAQLQQLRQSITNNFNETANKYSLKVIGMDLDQNYEAIHDGDDSNMPNMYAIESPMFGDENVGNASDITAKPPTQMKKVMLIKTDDGSNPFFTISSIDGAISDDQDIHTVSQEK